MTRNEAVATILGSGGSFFGCSFIRRTDSADGSQKAGDERHMVCRLGVHKHLRGGQLAFDPIEKNLLIVFDSQKGGYRSLPIDSITSVTFGGETYPVSD